MAFSHGVLSNGLQYAFPIQHSCNEKSTPHLKLLSNEVSPIQCNLSLAIRYVIPLSVMSFGRIFVLVGGSKALRFPRTRYQFQPLKKLLNMHIWPPRVRDIVLLTSFLIALSTMKWADSFFFA